MATISNSYYEQTVDFDDAASTLVLAEADAATLGGRWSVDETAAQAFVDTKDVTTGWFGPTGKIATRTTPKPPGKTVRTPTP